MKTIISRDKVWHLIAGLVICIWVAFIFDGFYESKYVCIIDGLLSGILIGLAKEIMDSILLRVWETGYGFDLKDWMWTCVGAGTGGLILILIL